MNVIELQKFVELKSLSARSQDLVSSQSPLTVMNHPSSRSHIARTSVTRLETDIRDFSKDENSAVIAVMKSISGADLNESSAVSAARESINTLLAALRNLKTADSDFVRKAVVEVQTVVNGISLCDQGHMSALQHNLYQVAGRETTIDFDLLAASTATAIGTAI